MRPSLIVIAICLAFVACRTAPLPPATASIDAQQYPQADWSQLTLGPNDILRVDVLGHPELSTDEQGRRVDYDGTIQLPLAGTVPVAGRTAAYVRDLIQRRLDPYLHEPDVSVYVRMYSARQFYVMGRVREPGAVLLDRPLTALQALALGGGVDSTGDGENVVVMRRVGDELATFVFNADTPGPESMLAVLPDDMIFVRTKGSANFRAEVLPVLQLGMAAIHTFAYGALVQDAASD